MKSKIIYVLLLLLVLLSVSAVSASDIANDTQEIQSVSEEVDLEIADENIQSEEVLSINADNSTLSSGNAGTFDDLQHEIDSTAAGNTLKLYRDYNGAYGSRIQIVKSITIDGQGHTLDCKKAGGCSAFYINDGSIILKNLIIINGNNDYNEYGGAIYSKTSQPLTVENCTFESNYAGCYGGAISSDSLLNVNHCTFKFNHVERKGGAIYAKECSVKNSTFEMNYASGSTFYSSDGGAIYTYGGNIVIHNSVFNTNTAQDYGGAIYTENTIYINWDVPQTNMSTFFTGNTAQRRAGGAIYAGNIYLSNASFSSNVARTYGGAIYAEGFSNIMDSKFVGNSAIADHVSNGGAIAAHNLMTVGGSTFINNTAYKGGAIRCTSVISFKEFNSFIGNRNIAIQAYIIEGEVKSQLFKDNQGSSAALEINGNSNMKMSNCSFIGNTGSKYIVLANRESHIEIVSCSFEGNTIKASPGHLVFVHTGTSITSIVHNFFIDNHFKSNGNGYGLCVYTQGTISNLSENVIRHCAVDGASNFHSSKDLNINEQKQPVNVAVSYDPYGFKVNQSGFVYFKFTNPDGSPVIGLGGVSKGGLQSEQNVEIKNSWITGNTLTVEIVPHQTGKVHITNAFDLDIDLLVDPILNSSVKLKPFENVTFGNPLVVYFEVENRTAIYYTISDDTGIIERMFPPSLGTFVNFTAPRAGNYKLTVYNVKGVNYLPSNVSANFTVYKAKTELSLTVSNTTTNNTVQGVISCIAAGNINVTIDGVTRTIKHAGGLSTFTWNYLSYGEHEASAVLLENDKYYTETATSKFKVSNPYGLEFNIIANTTEISYGESIRLSVNITSDATGNITWKFINGTIINTTNLNESVILTNVHPGSHTVLAYYSGDGKYNSSSNFIVFVVNSLENDVKIYAENITASNPVNITITGTIGGQYILIIDDFSKSFSLTNNSYTYNETYLPVGDHKITVQYKGNRDYKSKTVSTIFNVKKDQSSVKISEIANVTYGTTTTINFTVEHPVSVIMYIQDSDGKIIFEGHVNDSYSSVFNVGNYSVRIVNLGNESVNSSEAIAKFSVKKLPSSVKISDIGNVTYGEDTVINFAVENPVNVNIYIADSDGNMIVNKAISGNYSDSLSAGNYTVKITNSGNGNVESSFASAKFSVSKADVSLTIYVPDMVWSDSQSGYVFSAVDGNYTVGIDGKNIPVVVKEFIAEFNVSSLDVGEHEAIVIYDGDENYNSASASVKFNVTLKGTNLDIAANVTNITYGESIEVYVSNITQGVSGNISYYLSNGTFLGNRTVSENLTLSNLNAGTYVVIAKFTGDGKFNSSVATLKITVNKAKVNVTVKTKNTTYGKNSTVFITGIDGLYVISLDEMTEEFNISGGSKTVDVGILSAGTHNVLVYYIGDANHEESMNASMFEVSKLTPAVSIETKDINYHEVACINITSDVSGIFYVMIADKIQYVILTKGEKQSLVFRGLNGNESGWIINVTYPETENYTNMTDNSARIIVHKIDAVLNVTVEDVYEGEGSVINFISPYDIDGNVTVSVNGGNYSGEIDENGTFTIYGLPVGTYTALINFTGGDCYNPASTTVNITVNAINLEASDMTRGYNSGMDYQVKLTNSTGPVSGKNITFTINGKEYVVTTDVSGIAKLNLNLAVGTYNVLITNFNGKSVSKTLNIVNRITENKNVKTYYAKNYQYKLRIIGDEGSAVGSGVAVKVTVNGKAQTLKTDKNGYITVKFTKKYVPKTYKVIAEYKGFKVSNNIKVKQILKLKKVKVKKSAKKLVLKATLKQGSKALKKKKVTFKFKGKKYKVKTNKKGIAKVTIKKSVLKKLKVGKKVKYQVTYLKDTVKRTVKVKK